MGALRFTQAVQVISCARRKLQNHVSKVINYIYARSFSKAHGCEPVYRIPQSERIIGYGYFKERLEAARNKTLLETTVKRYEEHGMTWSSTAMGRVFINTIDPENIKAILATNFDDFGLGHRLHTFGPLLGRGIFTTDGAHWEHSRALVRPNFSKAQIQDLKTFEVHIKELINQIPRDGSTVDLQPLFFRLTLDSATEFLFGESVNSMLAPQGSEQQLFASAFDYAQGQILYRRSPGRFLAFSANRKFDKACKTVHDFADKYVYNALAHRSNEDKREKPPGRYVFLNELAKVTNDPRQLRDELLNILLAGRDTTASLLSNTFHVLARRPDIWRLLKAEVDQLAGEKPTYSTLRNMKYLRYLLNESLRLYPVVPTNSRFATKPTLLPRGGGPHGTSPIHIPAGQSVSYSVYAMHRRRDIYGPDAEVFNPSRWETLRVGWNYLPFNGGPRICVGQQFALTEAGYAVVRLCQEFERVEDRDGGVWREQFGLTTASAEGVRVGLVVR